MTGQNADDGCCGGGIGPIPYSLCNDCPRRDRTIHSAETDTTERVRRRLADGRVIADIDVHRLVAEIDRLRREKRFLFQAGEAGGAFSECKPDADPA